MTTWTPATPQSEAWTEEDQPIRVFSPNVFSHAYYNGKRVFAIGSQAGVYDRATVEAENWVNS